MTEIMPVPGKLRITVLPAEGLPPGVFTPLHFGACSSSHRNGTGAARAPAKSTIFGTAMRMSSATSSDAAGFFTRKHYAFYDYEKYGLQRVEDEDGMFTDRGCAAYSGVHSKSTGGLRCRSEQH